MQKEVSAELHEKYHFNAHWEAILSNGETIYQTDIEGEEKESDWVKLKEYVEENDLYIVELFFCYRNKRELVGKDQEAYFFCKSIMSHMNANSSLYYYQLGTVSGDTIRYKKWQVPGWMMVEDGEKSTEKYGDYIINGKKQE